MDLTYAYVLAATITGVLLFTLESRWALHPLPLRRRLQRLMRHGALLFVNMGVVFGMAVGLGYAQDALRGMGWVGPLADINLVLAGVLGFVFIDFADYLLHRLKHTPLLWPMHRLHHDDRELDWTTRFRFHPVEVVADEWLRFFVAAALGVPPVALAIHKIISHVHAQLEHQNLSAPAWLERGLGWVMITPGMHRIHHSRELSESLSNYGFRLSIWDRLLGTLRWRADWQQVETGIHEGAGDGGVVEMLLDPFRLARGGVGKVNQEHPQRRVS